MPHKDRRSSSSTVAPKKGRKGDKVLKVTDYLLTNKSTIIVDGIEVKLSSSPKGNAFFYCAAKRQKYSPECKLCRKSEIISISLIVVEQLTSSVNIHQVVDMCLEMIQRITRVWIHKREITRRLRNTSLENLKIKTGSHLLK